jgi:hypothetical protein
MNRTYRHSRRRKVPDDRRQMFIKQRRLPASACSSCGRTLDACTAASTDLEGTIPTAGKLTVCAYCGQLLVFTNDGLRAASVNELATLSDFERRLIEDMIKKPIKV